MSRAGRERILAAIKRAEAGLEETDNKIFSERLQKRQRGPLPELGDDLEQLFIERLQAAACSVAEADSMGQLGHQVLLWLQQQDVTPRLLRSATPLLDQVSWPDDLDVSTAGENNHYESTVCEAFCAIAETGSLVMLSSSSSPTLLNFLPDNFICVVQRQRIVQHIEDVWDRVRMEPDGMPRAINIITGPSRTADVEQTIQLGAHGPRKLHVILYS